MARDFFQRQTNWLQPRLRLPEKVKVIALALRTKFMRARSGNSDHFRSGDTKLLSRYWLLFLDAAIVVALLVHIAVVFLAANHPHSPWSGGGDAGIYTNLGQNLASGRGYTFAGTPTASRAPLYPLLLAGLMVLWPLKWRFCLRAIQLGAVLFTAAACAALAKKWGGQRRVGFLLGLVAPTLLFFQTEILTESIAAMLMALWWLYLCESVEQQALFPAALVGIFAGLASLERFNVIPIVLFGPLCIYVLSRHLKRALLTLIISLAILAPWIAHNWHAFGRPLYSTLSGFALVDGVLSPTGRGDSEELADTRSKLGWFNGDVESDSAPPELRDELALDAKARRFGRALWAARGLEGILKLTLTKIGAFWFSTDQMFATSTFSPRVRLLRWSGVAVYLIFLAAAVAGWFSLYRLNPAVAWLVLSFAVLMTAFHLPVTMNTRLRAPIFDPLIVSLATIGLPTLNFFMRFRSRDG